MEEDEKGVGEVGLTFSRRRDDAKWVNEALVLGPAGGRRRRRVTRRTILGHQVGSHIDGCQVVARR